MALNPKVRYGSTRLTFKRRLIEPLRDEDAFAIDTPAGTFVMTKRDFHRLFPNVVDSSAYRVNGTYSYATVPSRVRPFRIDPARIRSEPAEFELPDSLLGRCSRAAYRRWLDRETAAQFGRDRDSSRNRRSLADYKIAIHLAVAAGSGNDAYTGDPLDWSLLEIDPGDAAAEPRRFRRRFANLPTVDRVGRGVHADAFRTCSWKIAATKGDLDPGEFVDVCRKVWRRHDKAARDAGVAGQDTACR